MEMAAAKTRKKKKAPKSKIAPRGRPRRSAEETRAEILDAAQRRLAAGGADEIRLQEIAKDVGISHPAILHHFGSREGLIEALEQRITESLAEEVGRILLTGDGEPDRASRASLIESVARAMGERGLARTVAWWVLRGPESTSDQARHMVGRVTELLRVRLSEGADAPGRRLPDREEIAFSIRLAVLAMFGDVLFGDHLGQAEEDGRDAETHRFRAWLSDLLAVHLAFEQPNLDEEP